MVQHPPYRTGPVAELQEIPVEELIRLTREFTRRITNQDRQRLAVALRESGHQRMLATNAPVLLQQFFAGEIDLDTDLARRFANAPLLSTLKLDPEGGEPLQRRASAVLSSNDDAAVLVVDALLNSSAALEFGFTLFGAVGARFRLGTLLEPDRRRWLELMRRANGITFLWTRARWEEPYLVFVVRERYGRVYAFAPSGVEAAARLTPDMVTGLVDWLEELWFPGERAARLAEQAAEASTASTLPRGDWSEVPSHMRSPQRARHRGLHPDRPEQQWETPPVATPGGPPTAAPPPAGLEDEAREDEARDSLAPDEEW